MIKHRWKTRKNKRINTAYADMKYSISSMVSLLYRFQYISSTYRAIQILGIKTSFDKQKNNNQWSWNFVKGDLEKNVFLIEKTNSQFFFSDIYLYHQKPIREYLNRLHSQFF